jgi:hypothetical protein
MKWRLEGGYDTILHTPHPHLLEIRAAMDNHCEHKFDKSGRPIYIEVILCLFSFDCLHVSSISVYMRRIIIVCW